MKPSEARRLALMSSFSAFVVMVISMEVGSAVLEFFGITISAFQIAGGILLGGAGLRPRLPFRRK